MPLKYVTAEVYAVAPDTFRHLGVAISRGRDFDDQLDLAEQGTAIVSQALANRHFERGEAVGRRVRIGVSDWRTVVGIVGDRGDIRTVSEYAVYLPLAQVQLPNAELITNREATALAAVIPTGVALGTSSSMAEVFSVHAWFRRLLSALGPTVLALLALGMFVSARNEARAASYEIALRRAVGAGRREVSYFVVGLLGRRLAAALIAGTWLSLFLGAGLQQAYGSIPQLDLAIWLMAGAFVAAAYVLGSVPPLALAARANLVQGLSEAAPA